MMRWAERVVQAWEMRHAQKTLVGKPEKRLISRRENNKTDLKQKKDVRVWNRFNSIRKGPTGGLLQTW